MLKWHPPFSLVRYDSNVIRRRPRAAAFVVAAFRRRTLGVRVMLHRDRKLLLIRHRYGGTLMLPGGGVDSARNGLGSGTARTAGRDRHFRM